MASSIVVRVVSSHKRVVLDIPSGDLPRWLRNATHAEVVITPGMVSINPTTRRKEGRRTFRQIFGTLGWGW